ncbi:hypothetical protein GCM10010971_22390 [Silvimonas amylolytica]|uniref:Uncharacterized protein n=1 Tax=Silvimonas amylolytica TaxID=449663 RepID=A0ABQ2PLB9_9NEIS|nr:hypothetical protein GCM10010971_22390 [Silvimonas amylolytica]
MAGCVAIRAFDGGTWPALAIDRASRDAIVVRTTHYQCGGAAHAGLFHADQLPGRAIFTQDEMPLTGGQNGGNRLARWRFAVAVMAGPRVALVGMGGGTEQGKAKREQKARHGGGSGSSLT